MTCIATCKMGLEAVVAAELRDLGAQEVKASDARVFFAADDAILAKALIWLRAAERVLVRVGSFKATSFDELFEGVKAIDWKRYILKDSFIHVTGKSAKSGLFSVSDCQSITKKAIVESLKSAYGVGVIPESGKRIIVEVGLLRDEATLALDACGAGLSRRGYRTYNVAAPLSETLAAGIVLLSRYRGDRVFLDPMCGSGTLPIEAAMIAKNIAPGLNRSFAAQDWAFLKADCISIAKQEAIKSIREAPMPIIGSDIDQRSIALSKIHAKKAGVDCDFEHRDIKKLCVKAEGGILAVNPPYGERLMKKSEVAALYKSMRERFCELDGWGVHILSAYSEFERAYGLRAHKKRKLSNGGKSCVLYQYFPGK